jgi:hypothetical protein
MQHLWMRHGAFFHNQQKVKGRVPMKKLKKGFVFALALALVLSLCIGASAEQKKVYTIGIAQFAEHPSLDNCREGFIQGLADAGFVEGDNVKFIIQNAQADMVWDSRLPPRWRRSATWCAPSPPRWHKPPLTPAWTRTSL